MSGELWNNRDYRLWFFSDTLAQAGRSFGSFCFPLLILLTTGSTVFAGALQSIALAASAVMLIPAGKLVDSINRRTGVIGFGLAHAASMGLLTLLVLTNYLPSSMLVIFTLLLVGISTLFNLCVDAMLKTILPPAHLPQASAAEEVRGSALSIIVPPVAAATLAVSKWVPFLAASIGSFIAVLAAMRLKDREGFRASPDNLLQENSPYRGWAAGFTVIKSIPGLLGLLCISLLLNVAFAGVNTSLLYYWAAHSGTAAFVGLIATAASVGAIVGGLSAPRIVADRRGATVVRLAVAAASTALIVLPLVKPTWATLGVLFLAALPLPWFNAVLGGYMVAQVPNAMQARAAAAAQVIAIVVTPAAPLIAGFGLKLGSLPYTLAIFAAFGLAALIACVALPSIRSIGRPSQWLTWNEGEDSNRASLES